MPQLVFNPLTNQFDFIRDAGPTVTTGETLLPGEVLAFDTSGAAVKASATFALGKWRAVAIARAGASPASPIQLGTSGDLVPVLFTTPPAGVANGDFVFLSTTLGEATLVPPAVSGTVVFSIGVLVGADGVNPTPNVLFQPQYISRRP